MKAPKKRPVDLEGMIVQVQQQLTYLDKKIDTLFSQLSAKLFEVQQQPKPFQRPDQPVRQSEARQATNYAERVLHKTVCADCQKECEVPFRPTGDRPVYCRECFAKRKAGSTYKANTDSRPREEEHVRERHSHKHESGEKRRPYAKKTFGKKWKKRS